MDGGLDWIVVLMLVLGIIYGYTRPGKENRAAILKKALLIGVVLGVILGIILGIVTNKSLIAATIGSTIGTVLLVVIFAIFFIVGTVIGDWLEAKKKTQQQPQAEKK